MTAESLFLMQGQIPSEIFEISAKLLHVSRATTELRAKSSANRLGNRIFGGKVHILFKKISLWVY